MTQHHYHVGANMAGYMPEDDPAIVRTKAEAVAYLRYMRDDWLEDLNEAMYRDQSPYRWRSLGSLRDGHVWIDTDDPYKIPYHLWISDCFDPECTVEEY